MSNANPKRNRDFKFLDDLNLDPDVIKRLTDYLNSVIRGNNNVLMTPMGVDYGPGFLANKWLDIVEANRHLLNDTLYEYEMSELDKFSPRSIAKPWSKRQGDVLSYFKAKSSKIKINDKIKSILRQASGTSLRPISPTNALKLLKNTTNSGLPYLKPKKEVKPYIVQQLDEVLSEEYPAILFTRTQENNKTRTVWGYPIGDTLLEMRYYSPLLEHQKKLFWRSALVGPDAVDLAVSRIMKYARSHDKLLVSADYSSYDASVSELLINLAFKYINNLFQKGHSETINYIKDRFVNIPLLTPSGIYRGKHGIPSGSTFTNEVDSIVQYLLAISTDVVDDSMIQIQGDDGLYIIDDDNDYSKVIETMDKAGLFMNSNKSHKSKDFAIYLRNLYHFDYMDENGFVGGIYPTFRALIRLIFQERFVDLREWGLSGQDFFSLRSLAILENCKYHPLFEEFVLFIKKYNKYNLAFTQKGVSKYADMLSKQSGSEEFNKYRYGDDIKGIASFKSYQILSKVK